MAVGPTLHYSHKNVQRCWLLAVVAFGLSCLFWSKITTGVFWTFGLQKMSMPLFWRLGQSLTTGVSIFEYPWQIFVLGLLMGILAAVPILISQLMSFRYSVIFILEVLFLANLPGFALCLLISCIAAACRPLRFRSRYIAIALCTAPQLFYWGYFGRLRGVEPIEWGFSFAPWIVAWLDSLTIAGLVLGIGHFTRYRPGLTWIFTLLTLVIALVVFEVAIGFDELDYQLYIAKNNPEQVSAFHDHSITEALDTTTKDPATKDYLESFFYPTEPIALRAALKKEIQAQLSYDDYWPDWFILPDNLKYQEEKERLLKEYDIFIKKRPNSRRMAIALYYKALLTEYSPDTNVLEEKEILHFYSDYPQERAARIWWFLFQDFGNSPESIEARWRVAMQWAGRGMFEQADELLIQAQVMLTAEQAKLRKAEQTPSGKLFGLFQPPPDSTMTTLKLGNLQRRIHQSRILISTENRTDDTTSIDRLARFVLLNPYAPDYDKHLEGLLEQTQNNDPLRDNILLAQAKIELDELERVKKLSDVHAKYKQTDAGVSALYELGLLKISLWRQQDEINVEFKKRYLEDAKAILSSFLESYPGSFHAEQVRKNLEDLSVQ
jgi:hypothetical protein